MANHRTRTDRQPPRDEAGGLRARAERRLQSERATLQDMSETDVAALIHELRVHEVELEMQNEQMRESQTELERSRGQYADLFDFAPVGYFVFDASGCIAQTNLTGAALVGRNRRDLIGKPFNLFVAGEDKDTFRQHRLAAVESSKTHECTIRLLASDGPQPTVRLRSRSMTDISNGTETVYCRTAAIDVTGQQQAQQTLQEQEERLRVAVEGGNLGTWDRNLQTGVITWNQRLYGLLGRDPTGPPVTGETFFEYIHSDDRPRVRRHFEESLATRETVFVDEFRIVREDGQVRWLTSSGRIYRDRSGVAVRISGVTYDVTKRKRAEEALRQARDDLETQVQQRTAELRQAVDTLQEEVQDRVRAQQYIEHQNERLQAIIDHIPVMLCFYDPEGRAAMINEECHRVLGYSLEDLNQDDLMTLCYPDPDYRRQAWEHVIAAQPSWRDFIVQSKAGQQIASAWASVRLSDGSYISIGIDTRQRKRFENRLKESEQRYRTLVELSPDGIGVEHEGTILFVNATACELLRAEKADDLIGTPILDLVHPDDRPRTERQLEFLHRRRKPLRITEAKVLRLNGSVLDVELSAMPITYRNQPATQIVMRDITQRKQAERRLRENAVQLQQQAELLNLAHDTIIVKDMEGRILFWNRGAEQTYGWTRDEAIGRVKHDLLKTGYPGDRAEIANRIIEDGHWNGQLTQTTRDGRTLIVSSRWALQREEDGSPAAILEIDRDVTQQRKAEQAIAEARQFAESIIDTVREALIVLDADLRVLSANRAFYETFEVRPEDTEGRALYEIGNRQWDLPQLRTLLEDILSHNSSFEDFEVEHNFPHVGLRTMRLNARRIHSEDEKAEMILLAIRDITVAKQQEREIIHNQQQLADLTEELLLTEERERRRFAVALHDSIGQSLAFSKRELGLLRKELPEALLEKLDRTKEQIDEAVQQTRSLTFELSPSTLYTFGLEAAIEELAEQFSRHEGFECHLEIQDGDKPLSEQVTVLLYRATRELLINVAKHAQARNVVIRIQRVNGSVRIEVEDDGKGFDTSELESVAGKRMTFGLFSLRERLTHTHGSFDIESVPGDGTRITMQAPLQSLPQKGFEE